MVSSERGRGGVLKSVLFSVVFLLLGILIFAAAVKMFELSSGVITFVNQIIKVAVILLGCMLGLRNGKYFFRGMLAGALTMLAAYAVFNIIAEKSFFRIDLAYELMLGLLAGAISGMICSVLKKN